MNTGNKEISNLIEKDTVKGSEKRMNRYRRRLFNG